MKILLIDNYDSFTHNLAQYINEQPGVELTIQHNDDVKPNDPEDYHALVISPGPGLPSEAGDIVGIIREFSGKKPILGICLGLQAIYEAFGGQLFNLAIVQHGVTSIVEIQDPNDPIFNDVYVQFAAGRYHSWVCDKQFLPDQLFITAVDEEGNIMACRHKTDLTFGFQFHPESILTPEGKKMIRNFIHIVQENISTLTISH